MVTLPQALRRLMTSSAAWNLFRFDLQSLGHQE
jgi:hypothetical protein